jgi:hypothetical protein
MSIRFQISAMVFMMVQAILFCAGLLFVLLTPLSSHSMATLPVMIALSMVVSSVIAWNIAPRLRLRYWRERGVSHDVISG